MHKIFAREELFYRRTPNLEIFRFTKISFRIELNFDQRKRDLNYKLIYRHS
jgi:hypothetical protein